MARRGCWGWMAERRAEKRRVYGLRRVAPMNGGGSGSKMIHNKGNMPANVVAPIKSGTSRGRRLYSTWP